MIAAAAASPGRARFLPPLSPSKAAAAPRPPPSRGGSAAAAASLGGRAPSPLFPRTTPAARPPPSRGRGAAAADSLGGLASSPPVVGRGGGARASLSVAGGRSRPMPPTRERARDEATASLAPAIGASDLRGEGCPGARGVLGAPPSSCRPGRSRGPSRLRAPSTRVAGFSRVSESGRSVRGGAEPAWGCFRLRSAGRRDGLRRVLFDGRSFCSFLPSLSAGSRISEAARVSIPEMMDSDKKCAAFSTV